ncbi:uncharacterized protein TRIADDRAFT_56240 [Trichoplax adhaerens]|uniref:Luciferin 4-monooxygenase n=1 Tax=Trichoplax adhaerens TaxID=10228 RepID=B3RXK3_TRIAD|nr:hypothetical protein TRIADDRAFT_56240 [Trichoplax adhaerens]EDV24441.1 hypothetical protein TRIADDRAFT_56240 [Trichoplax adhaerens]|eukprot:XP_002112331.1 hypothetical protein TRIADDRAFT_56240 [Trichoplax adhaerens]
MSTMYLSVISKHSLGYLEVGMFLVCGPINTVDGITGRYITFGQFRDQIRRFGSYLMQNGFRKGDCLAIYSTNVLEYAAVYIGTLYAGGVVTTSNPLYTVRELKHQFDITEAKYVVTNPEFVDNVEEICKLVPIKERFIIGELDGFTSIRNILEDDRLTIRLPARTMAEDVAAVPFSSGTTGLAKGVCLTHRNIVTACQAAVSPEQFLLKDPEIFLCVLPLYHIFGMIVCMLAPIYFGVTVIMLPRFDPQVFLKCVEKYKVTYAPLVPPLVAFFAKHPMVDKYDISSMWRSSCGAAPLSKELQQAAEKRLKIKILQGYGMTETTGSGHLNPYNSIRHGSVGHLIPFMKCKVIDVLTGETLGPYKEGEILLKGAMIMKGYLKNEKATQNTIDKDGWLHTGDIGYYDSDEFFYVVDRVKELIKYKAFQVAPAELEALLMTHDNVMDAAVIGVPDEDCGELPKGIVVVKPGASAKDILEFVNKKVSPQKKLRGGIEFVKEIPKSASGKILRRVLKEREAKRIKSKY